jgi:hypothetical protein
MLSKFFGLSFKIGLKIYSSIFTQNSEISLQKRIRRQTQKVSVSLDQRELIILEYGKLEYGIWNIFDF